MAIYSHSKLSTFENCKYKYKLLYVDRIKVDIPTTVEAFMGSCVHEALEKLYTDIKFRKILTVEEVVKFYEGVWGKGWSEDIVIVKDYSKENYLDMGRKFLRDYYKEYYPFDQFTILGLETAERLRLKDGSFYHVRIDRLACMAGTYYVCDYKTNSKMKSQEEVDSDRQLAMYSIWVKNHFKDAKRVVLLWHMLAFNKELCSERTIEELKKLEDETIKLIKEIESTKEYPTNVTPLCSYCVYKHLCPSFKHEAKLDEKKLKDFEHDAGLSLVNRFALLKEKEREVVEELDKVKEELIGFANAEKIDVVFGSTKKVSVKGYEKVVVSEENKEKVCELLKNKGLFEELSILSWSKFNSKVLDGSMDKDVVKFTVKEKDFRISLSKKKEDDVGD